MNNNGFKDLGLPNPNQLSKDADGDLIKSLQKEVERLRTKNLRLTSWLIGYSQRGEEQQSEIDELLTPTTDSEVTLPLSCSECGDLFNSQSEEDGHVCKSVRNK